MVPLFQLMVVGLPADSERILVVIPSRLSSSRLPRKILSNIHGKPMVYWTYIRALSTQVGDVIVAVDSEEVETELKSLGLKTIMTDTACENGTERVYEVSTKLKEYNFFLNIQADEPLLNLSVIKKIAKTKRDNNSFIVAISDCQGGENMSEVKVALSLENRIRFASRGGIPRNRDGKSKYYKIHGVYLYSRPVLQKYVSCEPGPLEILEKVEQLRCIEHDIPLIGVITPATERSVDTIEDLEYIRSFPLEAFNGSLE